jgi:hypothetical protein
MSEAQYPFPFFNEEGRVHCQICGKAFLVITPRHLTYKHNVGYKEYQLRFPDAPLSTDEFKAKGKFGKMKGMFSDADRTPPKVVEVEELDDDQTEEIVDDNDIVEFYKKEQKKSEDPIKATKNRIYDHLRTYYTNIKMDYMVQEFDMEGRLRFEAISDFCDPVLKVVINFPDTFWHNRGNIDPLTGEKLKLFGWQVIEIGSVSPSVDKIDAVLENL